MAKETFFALFGSASMGAPFSGGMTSDDDRSVLIALTQAFGARVVVEFGVHEGGTARMLLESSPCIEKYVGIDVLPDFIPALDFQRREIPSVPGLLARDDPRFHLWLLEAGTQQIRLDDVSLVADMVFIDADHSYEGVQRDTRIALRMLKWGGIMCWHDYRTCEGVRALVDELNAANGDHICLVDDTDVCFAIVPRRQTALMLSSVPQAETFAQMDRLNAAPPRGSTRQEANATCYPRSDRHPGPHSSQPAAVAPRFPINRAWRIQHRGMPLDAHNSGLTWHNGSAILAYRVGYHNAYIVLAQLDEALNVRSHRPLDFTKTDFHQPGSAYEDPRLFVYGDDLYCALTVVHPRGGRVIGIALVRLARDLQVASARLFQQDRDVEKNWQFFEHEGTVCCVYTVEPHEVRQVDLETGITVQSWRHEWISDWTLGELRGGTPPLRIGDRYYSFFHSSCVAPGTQILCYYAGVYCFESKPPFRVLGVSDVLLRPPDVEHNGRRVVFPCGAVLRGAEWLVSYGVNDEACWIASMHHADILGSLRPVGDQSVRNATRSAARDQLTSTAWLYDRVGFDCRLLTFLVDGSVGTGAADCELFWQVAVDREGVHLDISSQAALTCRLTRGAGDVWRGRWAHHERMPVELKPVQATRQ